METDLLSQLLPFIPEKSRSLVTLLLIVSPLVTRGLHALINGRGLRGLFAAIWLGTNTPAAPTPAADKRQLPLIALLFAGLMLTGCAVTRIRQTEAADDGTSRTTTFTGMTFFDSQSALAKARTTMTDKSQGIGITGYESESSGSNAVDFVSAVTEAAVRGGIKAFSGR